jgi:hypothetical protein
MVFFGGSNRAVELAQLVQRYILADVHISHEAHPVILSNPCELVDDILHMQR